MAKKNILGLTPDPEARTGNLNRSKAPKAPKGTSLGGGSSGAANTFGYKGGKKGGMGRKGC